MSDLTDLGQGQRLLTIAGQYRAIAIEAVAAQPVPELAQGIWVKIMPAPFDKGAEVDIRVKINAGK